MRGTGITTAQMQKAPLGAIYIWVNGRLDYPKHLAKTLGREDLEIVSPGWLEHDRFYGRELTGIIIDHATVFNEHQRHMFGCALAFIRPARQVSS